MGIKEEARAVVLANDVPAGVKQRTNNRVECDEDGKVTREWTEQVTAPSAWRAMHLVTRAVHWVNGDDALQMFDSPGPPTHAVVKVGLDRAEPYHKGGPWLLNLGS